MMSRTGIDRDQHTHVRGREALNDQARKREREPQLVHRPASVQEEPVGASVMPNPRQTRAPVSIPVSHRTRVCEA